MPPLKMTLTRLLFSAALLTALTGCSALTRTEVIAPKVAAPESLVSKNACPDWPKRPASNKQSAAGKYLNGVAGVGLCWQTKHGALATIIIEHNKKMDELNARPAQ